MDDIVAAWLERYKSAWEQRNPAAAAALFTEDALYREQPYAEPFRGRAGVHRYWTDVTATQSDIAVRYGVPVVAADRAAVEWWVTLRNDGVPITLAGEFLLRFSGDWLVRELREYWHFAEGTQVPPPGWGA